LPEEFAVSLQNPFFHSKSAACTTVSESKSTFLKNCNDQQKLHGDNYSFAITKFTAHEMSIATVHLHLLVSAGVHDE